MLHLAVSYYFFLGTDTVELCGFVVVLGRGSAEQFLSPNDGCPTVMRCWIATADIRLSYVWECTAADRKFPSRAPVNASSMS
jgi:hypothetical protein